MTYIGTVSTAGEHLTKRIKGHTLKGYRDLLTSGSKNGQPTTANTVKNARTVLHKATTNAVLMNELLPDTPRARPP